MRMWESGENIFPAHMRRRTSEISGVIELQTVAQHCRSTASYGAEILQAVGLSEAGYLAGLLHDCGKYKKEFSDYIWAAYQGETVNKGEVNHTFAGCRLLMELFHGKNEDKLADVTCELLAFAVGAHHGQFDCMDETGHNGFLYRQRKEGIGYSECKSNFLQLCASQSELAEKFEKAHKELTPIYKKLMDNQTGSQLMFAVGQLARLLLSSVIDADRRDTAEFMDGYKVKKEKLDLHKFWLPYLRHLEQKIAEFPHSTNIEKARGVFSNLCRSAAQMPAGIYRLNLPTGGGKTISAMRFALAHASKWGKKRIVYVTPLLSILEQNAQVIRDFIGNDAVILEHHSNVLAREDNPEMLNLQELAAENWDSPIIITTLVQLLNTMFLGKTTAIRRYQALCNAVVIIDEVQTVPTHMLSLFNTAVNFLSLVCGTTFLLCSATQPCLEKAEHPMLFGQHCDIVPYQEEFWQPFQRTTLVDAGGMRLKEIPDFIRRVLAESESLLVICNKKSQAAYLYQQLTESDYNLFHLSSSMCLEHRRNVLKKINKSLENKSIEGRKTVCVSTQVMEAGVDISFERVIRLAAGMDSVIQSAGRCNRNGEKGGIAPVYIVRCTDEKLQNLGMIRDGKLATLALMDGFYKTPEAFGGALFSNDSVSWYYQKLYSGQPEGHQQYSIKNYGTIFNLLSSNTKAQNVGGAEDENYTLCQAFKTAGNLFRALEDATEDLIVPYGEGGALIAELSELPPWTTPEQLQKWEKRAKGFTVSVYDYQMKQLMGGIVSIQGILTLLPEYYDANIGLLTSSSADFLEV